MMSEYLYQGPPVVIKSTGIREGFAVIMSIWVCFCLLFLLQGGIQFDGYMSNDCFYIDDRDVPRFLNQTPGSRVNMADEEKHGIMALKIDKRWSNLGSKEIPLKLVMFTTFENSPHKMLIQKHVVRNWALFLPEVQPVLFADKTTDLEELINLAIYLGWHVYPVPSENSHGTPHIKDMYSFIQEKYQTHFYGLANGDILFDQYLRDTLDIVISSIYYIKTTMITSKRRQIRLPHKTLEKTVYHRLEDVTALRKRSKRFINDVEDYFFISSKGDFPWKACPDLVIGRPGYDNFLVGIARKFNVSIVDASQTLSPVHIKMYGKVKHKPHVPPDMGYNKRMIHKMYGKTNYVRGTTGNSQYISKWNDEGGVDVLCRRHKRKSKRKETDADKTKIIK